MVVMYTRSLSPPLGAYFLFGPRGTGKSTWVRAKYPESYLVDLLPTSTQLRYLKHPGLLVSEVRALHPERWIVIDEIQKVPSLLDDVHALMENHGHRRFVLTGSSARKLRKGASNLLAGRAVMRRLAPLNAAETNFSLDERASLEFGTLPFCVGLSRDEDREDFLRSYVETYLAEEIRNEGIVRHIGPFARFLDVAALAAGTAINVSGLARDAGVARDTVRGYLDIFEDTLLGSWLPAYRPRAKIKEVSRPKFYWFDTGVLNAAAGAFEQPMPADWQGVLTEHRVFHELSTYLDYHASKGSLGYWGTPSRAEVDFVWWYGDRVIAIEVKSASEFRSHYLKGIQSFAEHRPLDASYVIYRGDRELKVGDTWVLPMATFLRRLHRGEIVGA